MKKHILIGMALYLGFGAVGLAQFQPGDLFLRGSLGAQLLDSELADFDLEVKTFNLTAAPGFGYFLSSNLALGLNVDYSFEREQRSFDKSKDTDTRHTLRPQLFLRYYRPFNSDFGLWLDFYGGASIGQSKNVETDPLGEDIRQINSLGLDLGIRPGLYYFVARRWALEASIGGVSYSRVRDKVKDSNGNPVTRGDFSAFLDGGLGLRLGVSFFLNRAGE
jgi:hypothetical protein